VPDAGRQASLAALTRRACTRGAPGPGARLAGSARARRDIAASYCRPSWREGRIHPIGFHAFSAPSRLPWRSAWRRISGRTSGWLHGDSPSLPLAPSQPSIRLDDLNPPGSPTIRSRWGGRQRLGCPVLLQLHSCGGVRLAHALWQSPLQEKSPCPCVSAFWYPPAVRPGGCSVHHSLLRHKARFPLPAASRCR